MGARTPPRAAAPVALRRLRAGPEPELPTGDGEGGITLKKVGDFDQPLYVTQPPGDDRDLFVVEKTGRIRVVRAGSWCRRRSSI